MKHFLLVLISAILLPFQSSAQNLVSSEFLESLSRDSLISRFGSFIQNGVELYRITYTTPDIQGQTDTVSGLVVLPQALGGTRPLVIYQHGTINDRDSVPSQQSEEAQIPIVYAAVGGVAIAPDYLGFGASQGFHPYLHAETEASAGIDMIFAMNDFLEDSDFALNDQLFIAGYS